APPLTRPRAPWYTDARPTGDDRMSPTLTPAAPAVIHDDVRAFAAARGAADYLEPLLDLTRQSFPGAAVSVRRDDDPEIAGLSHAVFEVDATGRSADQLFDGQQRWTEAVVRTCPPAVRAVFVLGMR